MHRGNGKPRVHARDHEHGGADPSLIVYEDVGDSGTGGGGGGIQFDTYPQAGESLYIETDGPATSPSGFGIELFDDSGNGIDLGAAAGGNILIQTIGGGGGEIIIQAINHIILPILPTSDPGVTGALWNDGGTLKIS